MTNSSKLAAVGGGGTNISAPLKLLNEQNTKVDLVIVVSDNESWADQRRSSGTAMFEQWRILKKRNPRAKLVCIDIQPNVAKQVPNDPDILHVGGFSDNVFDVINNFVKVGGKGWVDVIKNVTLG
jgi:60 kDa SS-A/Ro ribonucleoprotein